MLKKFALAPSSFKVFLIIAIITTAIYFCLRTLMFLEYGSPIGDEIYFLNVHELIDKNGFYSTWSSGNFSPVFFLLSYPVNVVLQDPIISSRIISTMATFTSLFLLYWFGKKHLRLKPVFIHSSLIFIFSFLAYRIFWQGINDSLFHLLIICSLFPVHNIYFNKKVKESIVVLGILLGLLIGTRMIAVLVLPGYIFFFYKTLKSGIATASIAAFIGLLLHAPALYNNQSYCSVDKNPGHGMTWIQKNYVSQQLIYEGQLRDGDRITWENLENYIKTNGTDDIPNSFGALLAKKPNWVIQEFFKDFWFAIKRFYFPILGLGVILLIVFPFIALRQPYLLTKQLKHNLQFINFFWLHTAFIALVVLVQIEVRWFTAFIYLVILFYHQIVQDFRLVFNPKWQTIFLKLNLMVLVLFQIRFIVFDGNPLRNWGIAYFKSLYWL